MIDSTLIYIEKDGKVLLLLRNKKENDLNEGKWIGVGGKVETGETPEECVKRETYEETGLTLHSVHFYGIIHFRNDRWEDEEMYLYSSDDFSGELKETCDEGELRWVDKEEVLSLPTWEGDPYFLKPLLMGIPEIEMSLIYENDRLVRVLNQDGTENEDFLNRNVRRDKMNYEAIDKALSADTALKGHDFTGRYEGFREDIVKALLYMMDSMFPTYVKLNFCDADEGCERLEFLKTAYQYLYKALKKTTRTEEEAAELTETMIGKLPEIYGNLKKDVIAGFEGDPAAKNPDEVILAYPAFIAIATYRIAHELYLLNQQVIARIMSEYAHRKTGIDIHPGASIGEYFFIDHGTGVVIGETTVIGKHVKLYQHVTLGAKSFPVEEDGTLVKGIKRHPNVGDYVVIYAGATILGGDVYIGDHAVIGGNVWLTHSVDPGVTVTQRS